MGVLLSCLELYVCTVGSKIYNIADIAIVVPPCTELCFSHWPNSQIRRGHQIGTKF